jgi:DNA-binding transcriptional ArsR family regulator
MSNCKEKLPIDAEKDEIYQDIANYFKVLSHPARLQILDILANEELCVCDIERYFQMSQAAVSKHLKLMVEGGILNFRQDGMKNMYSIKDATVLNLLRELEKNILNVLEKRLKKYKKLNH